MSRRYLAAFAVAVMFIAGCGEEAAEIPSVVGKRLDVAKSDLSHAGVDEDKVEVVGGGTFGVLDESNWTVCEQAPSPGVKAKDVRVIVDRVCGAGDSATGTSVLPSTEAPLPPVTTVETTPPITEAPQPIASQPAAPVVLPNAVGMDLQAAQDTMQAAGFYALSSHDASGQDRFQLVDRNWKVCDQSPPGGSQISPDTNIDFGAVKDEERCP